MYIEHILLDTSVNFKKGVLDSSYLSPCPSVHSCGIILLQLDRFYWNLIL